VPFAAARLHGIDKLVAPLGLSDAALAPDDGVVDAAVGSQPPRSATRDEVAFGKVRNVRDHIPAPHVAAQIDAYSL
jgi:hypothetical protein